MGLTSYKDALRRTPYGTIGQTIRHFRKKNKLSQAKLAERIGCSQSSIAQYETDYITPPLKTLQKLALEFNAPVQLFCKARI